MSPEQVVNQAVRYLLSEGKAALGGFSPRDAEPLVKFTLSKLGKPPSLVPEEEIQELVEMVQEEVSVIRKKLRQRLLKKKSPVKVERESWYREVGPRDP